MNIKKFLAKSLLIVCISNAFAQDSEVKKGTSESDQEAIRVFVTASRGTEQDLLDVPQSTSTISKEDLMDKEFADVDDAIRREPGIGMAPAEGNPNYWQEGFTIRGLGAQRVLTLSDGIRLSGQGIGYGGGNLSLYDPWSIERIEILRGPASVLYGTDAFGGVINIITREPIVRDQFGYNGGARYSYDAQYKLNRAGGYFDFGGENYSAVIGSSYSHAGRPDLPDGEDSMSGSYRNWNVYGKTDFNLSQDTTLRFIGNTSRTSDILVTDDSISLPIATFPPPGSSALITSPLYFNIPEYQRSMIGAEVTTENLGNSWESFKSGLYWQWIDRKFHRETAFYPTFTPGFSGPPLFFDPSATVSQSAVDTDDEVNTYEWNSVSNHRFGAHLLTVGLDMGVDTTDLPETETQTVVGQAGAGAITGPVTVINRNRADASQTRFGLYAQDNWSLEPFEVVPGVRVDYFNVDDDESDFDDDLTGVSGSLGTVYRGWDEQSIYLNLATGFRAPDLGERFQTGIVNLGAPTQIIGQKDLDPERAYTIELGTKHESGRFNADFAGFFNRIEDYIGTVPVGIVNGLATDQYDNRGYVSLYGVEGALEYEIVDGWKAYGNAYRAWTNASEKIDVTGWVFNYGTSYTLPVNNEYIENIETGINLRTLSDSIDNTESAGRDTFPRVNEFTVVDIFANFFLTECQFGKASIVSGVRNLFDREYREPFFTLHQPGVGAYVALQIDF
ncbi:MAG: hypothetical protein DCC75_00380 [Proteobacteria bacterium]|nr:MAG: hypothetical protein DCC75_00380 [Pseudomonadota bacterium]